MSLAADFRHHVVDSTSFPMVDSAQPEPPSRRAGPPPTRRIGLVQGVVLVAGSMAGVGIFLASPIVAAASRDAPTYLALWAVGGALAFAGATVYAELGATLPRAGGDYAFLREALGPRVAVAAGWLLWLGVFAGSVAALASALFEYPLPVLLRAAGAPALEDMVVPLPTGWPVLHGAHLGPPLLVALFGALNAAGLRPSLGVLGVLTGVPITLFAGLSVLALLAPDASTLAPIASAAPSEAPASLLDWSRAYLAVYFAYAGWNAVAYVGGEVRDPGRTLPRSLLLGTFVVTALYLLLSFAFERRLGLATVAASGEAGTALARSLLGRRGEALAASLIAAALAGTLHATMFTGARVGYAMAADHGLPLRLAHLDPRTGMPARALAWQGLASVLLLVSGSFVRLLSMTSLAMQLLGGLVALSLFRLRRTQPDRPRPYRASGFPIVPGLYLLSTVLVLVASTVDTAIAVAREGLAASLPLWGLAVFAVMLWVTSRAPIVGAHHGP